MHAPFTPARSRPYAAKATPKLVSPQNRSPHGGILLSPVFTVTEHHSHPARSSFPTPRFLPSSDWRIFIYVWRTRFHARFPPCPWIPSPHPASPKDGGRGKRRQLNAGSRKPGECQRAPLPVTAVVKFPRLPSKTSLTTGRASLDVSTGRPLRSIWRNGFLYSIRFGDSRARAERASYAATLFTLVPGARHFGLAGDCRWAGRGPADFGECTHFGRYRAARRLLRAAASNFPPVRAVLSGQIPVMGFLVEGRCGLGISLWATRGVAFATSLHTPRPSPAGDRARSRPLGAWGML